jgi:hypothetical protein
MNRFSMAAALAVAALGAGAGAAQAQDTSAASEREIQGVASFGLTGGGKTLAEVQYTDGHTQSIKSGGLVELKLGLQYRSTGSPVATQLTVGYHIDDTNASNGSVRFSRYPVELLGYWHINDNVRLGGGLRWTLNPKLSLSGEAGSGSLGFKSSLGYVLEGEYLFSPRWGLSLRGVRETYNPDGPVGEVSGNHVGLRFNFYF